MDVSQVGLGTEPRKRVPVRVVRGWTPPGVLAWVPKPRTVIVGRKASLGPLLLAHELAHVIQWERFGWRFLPAYLAQWVRSGFHYGDMKFEHMANVAMYDPWYRSWASDLLSLNEQKVTAKASIRVTRR